MQDDLTSFWDEYARIQTRAKRNITVDSYSWGLEARLNRLLESPIAQSAADTLRQEQISSSAARLERARLQKLQQYYAEHMPERVSPVLQVVARDAIQRIKARVTPRQWSILSALGEGNDYAEIATECRLTGAGAARAQVFRLRHQLAAFHPAA